MLSPSPKLLNPCPVHTHTHLPGTCLALSQHSMHQYFCSWKHIWCDISSHLSYIFYEPLSLLVLRERERETCKLHYCKANTSRSKMPDPPLPVWRPVLLTPSQVNSGSLWGPLDGRGWPCKLADGRKSQWGGWMDDSGGWRASCAPSLHSCWVMIGCFARICHVLLARVIMLSSIDSTHWFCCLVKFTEQALPGEARPLLRSGDQLRSLSVWNDAGVPGGNQRRLLERLRKVCALKGYGDAFFNTQAPAGPERAYTSERPLSFTPCSITASLSGAAPSCS